MLTLQKVALYAGPVAMTRVNAQFWQDIKASLESHLGSKIIINSTTPVSGGDISQAYMLDCNAGRFFVKTNHAEHHGMFSSEANALKTIKENINEGCPKVICTDHNSNSSFIILEYLELSSRPSNSIENCRTKLAQLVAKLHSCVNETDKSFGWCEDNFIGLTPQPNTWLHNWKDFFIEYRIEPQFRLAEKNGFSGKIKSQKTSLFRAIETILADHTPKATLLHGDFWSGNYSFDQQGQPWIFDPASYYGDPETDIAMTELFGGFGLSFYRTYYKILPQKPGYDTRKSVYNLYHMFNHLNLFGSGYLPQVQSYIKRVIESN